MMEPPPSRCMPASTAWMAKNAGRWFTAMRSSQYSGVTSAVVCRSSLATLFTSTWKSPSAVGRRADGALQVAGIADVAALEPRFRQVAGAQPLQQRRGRPGIDVDECHARALPAEPLHQAGADAGATAGNEHAPVPEAGIHRAVRGELRCA